MGAKVNRSAILIRNWVSVLALFTISRLATLITAVTLKLTATLVSTIDRGPKTKYLAQQIHQLIVMLERAHE
jgi:hypothetical protein